MRSIETGGQLENANLERHIERGDIALEVAVNFQNKLSLVMAPDKIRPYLSHDDPQTDLEIAYANKWMNKYADPEGAYNGFQSFCDSETVEHSIKGRLLRNEFIHEDLLVAKQYIEGEGGPLFENDEEVDEFLKEYLH